MGRKAPSEPILDRLVARLRVEFGGGYSAISSRAIRTLYPMLPRLISPGSIQHPLGAEFPILMSASIHLLDAGQIGYALRSLFENSGTRTETAAFFSSHSQLILSFKITICDLKDSRIRSTI